MNSRPFMTIIVSLLAVLAGAGSLPKGIAFAQQASSRPSVAPSRISLNAMQQIEALQQAKALRTPAQRKMDSRLIYAPKIMRRDPLMDTVPMLRSSVDIAPDGTTLVDIKAKVTPSVLSEIKRLGGTVISSFKQYYAIRAHMPLEQIETLAEHPDIRFIGPAAKAFTNKVNTSEGDVAHNAAAARSTFGVDGAGVKIGVLSDSVDYLASVQATGDLPNVTVLENAPGNTGEGTAMLEIVHDLAPGASLYFATAWTGMAGFASNILALRARGCDVIVDDVTYFPESPFQDDVIAQAVNTVTADGALYFSSAGNGGNLNDGTSSTWEGDFSGTADPTLPPPLDGLVVHDFSGGDATNQIITSKSASFYYLFWSDPLGGSGNDYDLYALDPFDAVVAVSDNVQDGDDDPLEGLHGYGNLAGYQFVVAQYGTPENRFLHFNSFGTSFLEHTTAGQIKGHPAAADAFGVAAVDARARTEPFDGTESVETFSSDGQRRVFYDADGTPITPGNFSSTGGELRQKPDIAAADGVATATPGFNPFYGTSAAAPHAAGVAALVLSAEPSLTADDVRDVLTGSALDIEAVGWDRDSGVGIVMADRALPGIGLYVRPLGELRSRGLAGGPFSPLSKEYVLENKGDTSIEWQATKGQAWVDLSSPDSGTLNSGQSVTVTVSINNNATSLARGSYTDTIHFANNTHGYDITRDVCLDVGQAMPGVLRLLTQKTAFTHKRM